MKLDEFKSAVSKRMLSVYGLDWDDACGDNHPLETAISDGWTAEEFVDWFGRKYDLDTLAGVGIKNP